MNELFNWICHTQGNWLKTIVPKSLGKVWKRKEVGIKAKKSYILTKGGGLMNKCSLPDCEKDVRVHVEEAEEGKDPSGQSRVPHQ